VQRQGQPQQRRWQQLSRGSGCINNRSSSSLGRSTVTAAVAAVAVEQCRGRMWDSALFERWSRIQQGSQTTAALPFCHPTDSRPPSPLPLLSCLALVFGFDSCSMPSTMHLILFRAPASLLLPAATVQCLPSASRAPALNRAHGGTWMAQQHCMWVLSGWLWRADVTGWFKSQIEA